MLPPLLLEFNMPATVEDEFNNLVEAIRQSEYTRDEALLILKEYIGAIYRNNIPDDQRYGVAMTTADYNKKVRSYHWKFAHGFYGNWAKAAIEAKDQDVGC